MCLRQDGAAGGMSRSIGSALLSAAASRGSSGLAERLDLLPPRTGGHRILAVDVSLKCHCGAVRGRATSVNPAAGFRIVCMCDDCQAYAYHLGRSDEVLDANGGTDIFQLTPAQLTLTQGTENLRCLRLTERGLLRWYAGCCNTPIANTLASAKMPFAGVPHTFMDHAADGQSRDEALGPVVARVQGRFGKGEMPEGTHRRAPFGAFGRIAKNLFLGWLRGKHRPSPFFDPSTGHPTVEPSVLSRTERERAAESARSGVGGGASRD